MAGARHTPPPPPLKGHDPRHIHFCSISSSNFQEYRPEAIKRVTFPRPDQTRSQER